jgi:redox-sensitive bicupin YhaK (pirin superfamily)
MFLQKLAAKPAHVAHMTVRRVLPQRVRRMLGPFCFLDHFGPNRSLSSATAGVASHPHIGLATVTYLFEGAMLHKDSLGTVQRIEPGAINWMTAGSGIVHAERLPSDTWGQEVQSHGLQLWVALAAEHEECAPSFQHAPRESLPIVDAQGLRARVLVGSFAGQTSPVVVSSETLYVVAELDDNAILEIPAAGTGRERGVYVVSGGVQLGDDVLVAQELGVLGPEPCALRAREPSIVALLGGAAFAEPRFMSWNFVSSRKERLAQAEEAWRKGDFPGIEGEHERIAMPGRD